MIVGVTTSVGVALIAASIVVWAVEKRCTRLRRNVTSSRTTATVQSSVAPSDEVVTQSSAAMVFDDRPPARGHIPPRQPSSRCSPRPATKSGESLHRVGQLLHPQSSSYVDASTLTRVDTPSNNLSSATGPSTAVVVHTAPLTPPAPPPPPPSALSLVSTSRELVPASLAANVSPPSTVTGSGSPRSTTSSLFRATLMLCTVLAAVASGVVASGVSNCPLPVETRVTVVLRIPTVTQLDKLKVFFNERHRNEISLQEWTQRNETAVNVFDVSEVLATERSPCRPEQVCPAPATSSSADSDFDAISASSSASVNLIDCDSGSASCVCQRGYVLVGGSCVDYDECADDVTRCGDGATCQNVDGSFTCRCRPGHYRQLGSCRACASSCSGGFFESVPCSAFSDRVCTPCSDCQRHEYEAIPCRASRDRVCLHAAHPLLTASNETIGVTIQGLRVEHSDNLFLENLHNTRNLETTYYVTDVKQQTDFFWFRNSEIRINIGLQNVNVVPVFEDVDHRGGGETSFITGPRSPHSDREKNRFDEIVRRYCRHPVPDYYTVTLETLRDRTTRARTEQCTADKHDNDSPGGARCPPGVHVGDRYVRRLVNESCEKTGSTAVPQTEAVNSIVCTDDNPLLRTLFNITPTPVHLVSFPSKRCRSATSRCEQCLLHDSCQATDLFDQRCCQVDCYSLNDCKQTMTKQCQNTPVECATGDVYRYTLQPIYTDLNREYSCHLRRRRPETLYQLWFYVTVPGTNFETPRVNVHFPAPSQPDDVAFGSHQATQFLTIEHSTGIQLIDDVIITGRAIEGAGEGEWNYTVKPAQIEPAARRNFSANSLPKTNLHVVATRFTRPFAYSTSTWVGAAAANAAGSDVTGCNKDVSLFVPVGEEAPSSGNNVTFGETPVTASIRPSKKPPHEYLIKSTDSSPLMKFIIPANVSVLRWWFQQTASRLAFNDSFNVGLTMSADGRFWEIRLTGYMTGCPGYLGLTVNDRRELEEVFRYDVLVSCPPKFNVTLFVPNWQPTSATSASASYKTFDVLVDDAHFEYRMFLTNLVHDDVTESCTVGGATSSKSHADHGAEAIFSAPEVVIGATVRNDWQLIVVVLSITLGGLLLFIGIHACLDIPQRRLTVKLRTELHDVADGQETSPSFDVGRLLCDDSCRHGRRRRAATICATYAVLRVLFGLSLTFTVLSTAFELSQRQRIQSATGIAAFPVQRDVVVAAALSHYERHLAERHGTGSGNDIRQMQSACDGYMSGLADVLSSAVDASSRSGKSSTNDKPVTSTTADVGNGLSASIIERFFDSFRSDVQRYTLDFRHRLIRRMRPVAAHYRRLLARLVESPWLAYPSLLVNRTSGWSSSTTDARLTAATKPLTGDVEQQLVDDAWTPSRDFNVTAEMRSYSQILEVELGDINVWTRRIFERFREDLIHLRQLTFPAPCSTSQSSCVKQAVTDVDNGDDELHYPRPPVVSTSSATRSFTDPSTLDRMNSTRFFPATGDSVAAESVGTTNVTWVVEMSKNRVRPTFESSHRGTQWAREPATPHVEAVLNKLLHYEHRTGLDWSSLSAMPAGVRRTKTPNDSSSSSLSTAGDSTRGEDNTETVEETVIDLREIVVSKPDSFDELVSDFDRSLYVVRCLLLVIDVLLIAFHVTRTYSAAKTLFSAGFSDRRLPAASDIVAKACNCSPGAFSSGDGSVAIVRYSFGPVTTTTTTKTMGVKEDFSKKPPPACNGGRSLRCCDTVVVTSMKSTTVGCAGNSIDRSATALVSNHCTASAPVVDVPNCVADCAVTSSSQSQTMLLPISNCHDNQNHQSNNSIWCTVKHLCRQSAEAVPTSSSSSSSPSDFRNALVGVVWRLVSRRPPILPAIGVLIAAVVFVQFAARTAERVIGESSHTTTTTTASGAVGGGHIRSLSSVSWLVYVAGLVEPAKTLLSHVDASNRFGGVVDESRSRELDDWYRRHMVFEMANLRGAFQVFDEDESTRRQRYQDDLCALEAMTKPWADAARPIVCDAIRAMTSLNGSASRVLMLPCNFVGRRSDPYPVCGDIDRMSSLAAHFIESVLSCIELAVAFADAFLVVASAAVLISAAERCLLRVLRHWHLLPTRLIYLIPPGVYETFRPIAGDDDISFSTSRTVSAVALAQSECGDALPSTTVRTFRSTDESVGLQIPAVAATRERQKAWSDAGTVLWRDSLPSSTASDGPRSQFSETKV